MNKKYIIIITLSLLIAGIGIFIWSSNQTAAAEEMKYTDFQTALSEYSVESATIHTQTKTVSILLKESPEHAYTISHPLTDDFVEQLLLHDVQVTYESEGALPLPAQLFLLIAVLVISGYFIMNKKKTMAVKNVSDDIRSSWSFADIAGNEEAKLLTSDIISFIKEPEKYDALGAKMPRGLLFYGPPGTGKTLMARAIAGEADVPFYSVSGSDFVQTYVGVGASRVRDLFTKAKKAEKAVIFIDEIDALGKKRGASLSASNDERDQTLNALLTEMSGFATSEGIVVIGATNRLDVLDEALLRPGRFDRQIEIGLPDLNARKKILSLYINNKPVSEQVNIKELAKSTVHFSGAMLENLVNEAAIAAANEEKQVITSEHIDKAFYQVIAGAPKSDRSFISQDDMKVTAFHEAGHALTTMLLLKDNTVSKVTIIPSTKGAGGFSMSIPKESPYMTKQDIISHIKVLLSGRAAEAVELGEDAVTTGAGNDLEKAAGLIQEYIYRYGMDDEFGLFSIRPEDVTAYENTHHYAQNGLKTYYEETKELLNTHYIELKNIAAALLEKETLNEKDLKEIVVLTDEVMC